MTAYRIPFNRAYVWGNERRYMDDALERSGIAGGGAYTRQCEAYLERELGTHRALLTTSCTHALEMAALLLDIGRNDEIILPAFTFVSTVNAFVLRGARPVFADIRADTLNLDERQLESLITPRTRAIVPVHYAGVGCEMDTILDVAGRHGLAVVEDNAQGLFGRFRGQNLGTLGALAALSFHETKNFTCGEGGALLLNDPRYVDRAEVIREKGTNRSRFFRGEVDKYTWVDVGSSYVLSEMLAAFLLGQLEARARIELRRREIWHRYHEQLRDWASARGVTVPLVPAHCEQPYHLYYLLLPSLKQRTGFIAHLRTLGILSVFHYVPLHLSEMGQRLGGKPGDCPVTEDVSDRLVRLPFYAGLTPDEQTQVIDGIRSFPG
jgi:dTDP-4-amino-4,6-dideoxygalactose transaminase